MFIFGYIRVRYITIFYTNDKEIKSDYSFLNNGRRVVGNVSTKTHVFLLGIFP